MKKRALLCDESVACTATTRLPWHFRAASAMGSDPSTDLFPAIGSRAVLDRLPRRLLRVEGIALFTGAIILYFHADYPWWLLLVLALAPDLSMLGYFAGPRAGSVA